jgi:hypothetical protein
MPTDYEKPHAEQLETSSEGSIRKLRSSIDDLKTVERHEKAVMGNALLSRPRLGTVRNSNTNLKPLSKWIVFPLIGVVVVAFLILNAAPGPRYHDPLFWCLSITTLYLVSLATTLHYEPSREDRIRYIRTFCLVEVLVFVIGALYAIVREGYAGHWIR